MLANTGRRPAQYNPHEHPHFYCEGTAGDISGGGTLSQFKRRTWRRGLKLTTPARRIDPATARRLYVCAFLANRINRLCNSRGMSGIGTHDQIMPLPTATYPDTIANGQEEYLLGGLSSGVGRARRPFMPFKWAGGRPGSIMERFKRIQIAAKKIECKQALKPPAPTHRPPPSRKYQPKPTRGRPETHIMPSRAEPPPKLIESGRGGRQVKYDPSIPPPFIDPIYPPPLIGTLPAQNVEPREKPEYGTLEPQLGISLRKIWRKVRIATKPARQVLLTALPAILPGGIPGGADGELSPEEAYQAQAAADVAARQGGIPWWVWAGGGVVALFGGVIIIKAARKK